MRSFFNIHKQSQEKNYSGDISILETWRFFIDGILQQEEKGWMQFEERESGYLRAVTNSMAYALSHINDQMDVQFIKTIHRLALSDVTDTNYDTTEEKPGEARSDTIWYALAPQDVTKNGITEIISLLEQQDFLRLYFKRIKVEINSRILAGMSEREKKQLVIETLDEIKKRGPVYIEGFYGKEYDHNRKFLIEKQLSTFINEYESAVKNAENNQDQKIRAILSFVRNCEHMHVFADGNGRTFYMIALYYLFIKNGLQLPLMEDINHISGNSLDEIIIKIKKGWENTQALSRDKKIFDLSTSDILASLNKNEMNYFINSLQPLIPFFKSSEEFDFVQAYLAKNKFTVNEIFMDSAPARILAYKLYLSILKNNDHLSLESLETYFPELYDKLIHHKDNAAILSCAASNGEYQMANLMLTNCADKSLKDKLQADLFKNLKSNLIKQLDNNNYYDICHLLKRPCEEFSYTMSLKPDWREEIIREYLIEKINSLYFMKVYLMKNGLPKLFNELINSTDKKGYTPLMYAANNREPILKFLLKNGADHTLLSCKGETALDIAKKHKNNDASIRLLKSCEKDIDLLQNGESEITSKRKLQKISENEATPSLSKTNYSITKKMKRLPDKVLDTDVTPQIQLSRPKKP